MATNAKTAKSWPESQEENFGYSMGRLRDNTADILIDILRAAEELHELERNGSATRSGRLSILAGIQKGSLLALMNMMKAGAPVDPAFVSRGPTIYRP